jgi:putative hydrolase of the HAD superfamily
MKYDVILCDADGVLVKAGVFMFSEQLSRDHGISIEKMLPFFKGAFALCSVGKADLKEELAKVAGDWGWTGTVDELVEYWLTKGTQFDDDVLDYIRELKGQGTRCYIATDNERYRGEFLTQKLGHGQPFDEIFYSAKIGTKKHDPDFFQYVHDALGGEATVPKSRIVFVDDDQKNVETARAFGFDAHLYTTLSDLKDFLA